MKSKREFLSVDEVAQKLGVSRWTVYRWIKVGQMKAVTFQTAKSERLRIHVEELEHFLERAKESRRNISPYSEQ
jgi:excisionase family DNA binding protein